jgi:hypothetical protein
MLRPLTPATLLRWYRTLIACKWNYIHRRGPGRPRTRHTIVELIIRMAVENPSWRYTRIQGALANLGHEVGRTTVANTLREQGIEPAPNGRGGLVGGHFSRPTGNAWPQRISSPSRSAPFRGW